MALQQVKHKPVQGKAQPQKLAQLQSEDSQPQKKHIAGAGSSIFTQKRALC